MKLCFVDTLGLTYDGSTLEKRGLGGSESAVILLSKELVKLGIEVTVFNDCTSDDSKPGLYDGVLYRPLKEVEVCDSFDVVIASRSVVAFAPVELKDRFKTFSHLPNFQNLQTNSTYKILWMHDTFCDGDDLIEDFILNGLINEIFTLSDWHLSYVTNCDHGKRRNFDLLKNHVFLTRNGIGKHRTSWVDVRAKDPNLFVFNSSVTKGMIPLVSDIWPKVKERHPEAKLKVIGGYYRFRSGAEPDQQELDWRKLVSKHPEIEFTGIIPQPEIYDILTEASYMIYPCGFPETFGISTLEALAHNVPIITCRFGALEETALDIASYKIPYPVEPNWSLPWLNKEDQVTRFVDMVSFAYTNKYLHQQKMYACNQVKDICHWDSVALQWKQHLYKATGNFMSVDEYQKVTKLNSKVRKIFNRRFLNSEELVESKQAPFNTIYVITPVYNAESYIKNCILSVAQQDYSNYKMFIIDDASTDSTLDVIKSTIDTLSDKIKNKFRVITNTENKGAVCNQVETIRDRCGEGIAMLLDGDDWLISDPTLFDKYNNLYNDGAEFTYGSCWSLVDNIPLIAQEYPPEVKQSKSYRDYKFNWNMPYTHLRTFKSEHMHGYLHDFGYHEFKDEELNWIKAGGDTAIFYTMLECADSDKVVCIPEIVLNYNDINPLNDFKINGSEQTKTANSVLASKKKYSVVLPTMWRCEELTLECIDRLQKHPLVDEIILINNDSSRTPWDRLSEYSKVKNKVQQSNIGVNPAWNLGVELATNDLICIVNDDIVFDTNIFNKLESKLFSGSGPYGLINGDPSLGQPESTDNSISFKEYEMGECIHCFGQLFFIHKSDWVVIPSDMKINFGDDFIFHSQLNEKKNKIHLIYNIEFKSPMSATVSDKTIPLITEYQWKTDQKLYQNYVESLEHPKKILIAIPTSRYIEVDTFKSIYDLEIPAGYTVEFRYSFGYRVDQVRNKIADWAVSEFDYLFAVDHDVVFAPDTLKKLLSHDKPLVSGIYRQRLEPQAIEIYDLNMRRIDYSELYGSKLTEIGGCGFGCVLVKSEVLRTVGHPQFEYHVALDHNNTFSEDVDFCLKARNKGFQLYCDPTILCGHLGSSRFDIRIPEYTKVQSRLLELKNMDLLPREHVQYLHNLGKEIKPKVIYDIGACVLHWSRHAREAFPGAQIIAFEAMDETQFIYQSEGISSFNGLLSDVDGKQIEFYQNLENPGGNSAYREKSSARDVLFPESCKVTKTALTLDTVRKANKFPAPDMLKLDVQGSELDILKGAVETLQTVDNIIIELPHEEYNEGSPNKEAVIEFLHKQGFSMVGTGPFCGSELTVDGDYRFIRTHRNQ